MVKIKSLIPLVVMLAMFIVPSVTFAQPLVCGFYGSVTLDGEFVPTGTTVKAWIELKEVATVTTVNSQYNMYVAGSHAGKTVYFTVGAADAPALMDAKTKLASIPLPIL